MVEVQSLPKTDSIEEITEIDLESQPNNASSTPVGVGDLLLAATGEAIEVREDQAEDASEYSRSCKGDKSCSPHVSGQRTPSQPFATAGSNALHDGLQLEEPSINSSDHPWLALLVFLIVALNVGVFFITMYFNDCPKISDSCFLPFLHRFSFQPLRENPLIGPSSQTLERLGALDAVKVQRGHQGWRLISCTWLHAGVVHLTVNMLSLLFVGVRLEQEFGPVRICTIYLLSGLGGSLLSVLFLQSVSVGASGALFGLVGAMLAELLMNWTIYTNKEAQVGDMLQITCTSNHKITSAPLNETLDFLENLCAQLCS